MKRQIWVLSGSQGAGKSTYARWIQSYYPIGKAPILSFAKPIYDLHDACLPILKALNLRPETMKKDGELLQVLGTEYGRAKLGDNVWVNVMKRNIEIAFGNGCSAAIIDDCRFENEFWAFHNDAHMVRLWAPEAVRKARCSYWRENSTHASETSLDEFERKNMFHAMVDTQAHDPREMVKALMARFGHLDHC